MMTISVSNTLCKGVVDKAGMASWSDSCQILQIFTFYESECLNVVIVLIKTLTQIALTLQGFNCCVEGLTCVWGNDHYSQCLQLVDSNGKSRSTRHVSLFHSLASVQCHNVCSSTLRKSVRRLPGSLLEEMCTSEL